jgi:hypothetical protein
MARLSARGCLGTVIPVIVVLAGLLAGGDLVARNYATNQLAARVRAAVPEASGVHARIRSFPFVGHIAWNGHVSEVGVHIDRLAGVRGLAFTDVDVDLRGVVVDSNALFTDRRVELKSIRQGTITASVSAAALSSAVGRPVNISGGGLSVVVFGRPVTATVAVRGAVMNIAAAGLAAIGVPLPTPRLLPCGPTITFAPPVLRLSCTFTQIPPALVRAASS